MIEVLPDMPERVTGIRVSAACAVMTCASSSQCQGVQAVRQAFVGL